MSMDIGKLPPQSIELESAVLGAMLLDSKCVSEVLDILRPEDFYKEDHRLICEAVFELSAQSKAVDILTVTTKLKDKGNLDNVGGALYIAQLTNRVGSSAHVESHSRIIKQDSMRRQIISICSEMIKSAYDNTKDVFDLLAASETGLNSIGEGLTQTTPEIASEVYEKTKQEYFSRQEHRGVTGIQSDSSVVDEVIGGWNAPDLVILAARPGMGKTAKALCQAMAAAKQGKAVAFFTLEMSSKQLMTRMIAAEADIPFEQLSKGYLSKVDWPKYIKDAERRIKSMPIYFIDKGALSIFEFKSRIRRLKKERNIELAFIDYLQLMVGDSNKNGNREQEISFISRNIKATAKELNIPIIALSQLSRSVETRGGDKMPMLSDLRESGAIEQDADIVLFLYRPEYYGMTHDSEGNSTENKMVVRVAKFRNGNTKDVTEACCLSKMQTGTMYTDTGISAESERNYTRPIRRPTVDDYDKNDTQF